MGNSTPNTRRNVISGIVALIVILIILLCLRLCKHDEEDVPTPQATPSASTPQDTIKQDTTTVLPKAWHKVSRPKRKRKVIAASALQPAEKVAVIEKKAEPAVVQETPKEQPKQQTGIEPESDDVVIDTAEIIREPKPRRVFLHKRYYQTRISIRAGVGYSVIANLGALVEDGAVRPRYTMEENGAFVPSIGVFALWRHDRLGVELAADYTWLSSTLKEHKQIGNIDEKTGLSLSRHHASGSRATLPAERPLYGCWCGHEHPAQSWRYRLFEQSCSPIRFGGQTHTGTFKRNISGTLARDAPAQDRLLVV